MKFTLSLAAAAAICAASCAHAATTPDTPCSANFATTGVYRNYSFGFTMTIPPGLKATWSSPPCSVDKSNNDCICMNDHGRNMALDGGGTIGIYADHNATSWTLPTVAFNDLSDFKGANKGDELIIVSFNRIQWKAMGAYRYVARRENDGEATVRESVVATGRDGEMFLLYIEAPQEQYERYRPAFNAMLKSWRSSPVQ